jgi:hypothetical protein
VHAPPIVRRRGSTPLSMETIAAGILAALMTVPSPLSVSLSIGAALSLALIPVTVPTLWRTTEGRGLVIALLALVPVGWLTAQPSLLEDNGRAFSIQLFLYQAALPVGLFATVVGAYWCVNELGLQRFLFLSLTGLLATASLTLDSANPWKYGLALPVSMLVILSFGRNRLLLGLVVTPLIVAVSIAADFRSWVAFVGIAMALVILAPAGNTRPSASAFASRGIVTVAGVLAIGALVTQASTAGLLGETLARRTNRQLDAAGGNLILGGRPEWGAGFALWRENPFGIGIGVTPSSNDYWLAIRNMPFTTRGLQELSTVADNFRQGLFDLHSTFMTFWCIYGIAGVGFCVLALYLLVKATVFTSAVTLARPNVQAAVALLMLATAWDVLFSPTNPGRLGIALAVALYISSKPNVVQSPEEGFTP